MRIGVLPSECAGIDTAISDIGLSVDFMGLGESAGLSLIRKVGSSSRVAKDRTA